MQPPVGPLVQYRVPPARPSLSHLPVLDSVRGVALLLVIVFHAAYFSLYNAGPLAGIDALYWKVASAGWCGVDLFFVLSGFLITRILLHTRTGPDYLRTFYARRVLRIFPLYYGVLLVWFAAGAFAGAGSNRQAAPWLFTYSSNLVVSFTHGVFKIPLPLQHLWSLAIEEQFYLAWPLVVLVTPRRWLGAVCLALFAGALVAREAFMHAGNGFAAYIFPLSRVDALALGGAAAWLFEGDQRERLRAWGTRGLAAAAAVLGALVVWRGGLADSDWWVTTAGISLLAVTFAAALVVLVTRGGRGSAPLAHLGRYSYGMYVFHQPVILVMLRVVGARGLPLVLGSRLPALLAFTVAANGVTYGCARLSWWALEERFLRLKSRFEYRGEQQPRARAAAGG